jgi:hypothetical protein
MTKVILFLGMIFSFHFATAQEAKQVVKADLLLLNKLRVTYEKPIKDKISIGGAVGLHYGSFSGIKVEPFARYYVGALCPEGLYLQGRALAGFFSKQFDYWSDGDFITGDLIQRKKSVSSFGFGADLGYQWISGKKKNIAIDLSLGIQLMSDINNDITVNGVRYSSANVGFASTGPGAVFNPRIMIGYAF